ncbi:MAG: redoxin domain-containing protein [Candidatus Paceibacterota bacterium]|jgi:peroxiredoxin (alkyl hydroperoxide reductase subunit C)|nr:redoxin domain-containing protein [Candidatus Paceibacterota bacterium]
MCDENCNDECFSGSVGEKVPSYEVRVYQKEEFSSVDLADYHGKWLVLFFYPADFTFICPTELEEMAEKYEDFKKLGAEIISVSTDTVFTHKAWHDTSDAIKKIAFPMAADRSGELSQMFGTYIYDGEDTGSSLRGTFIIDPEGIIRSAEINDNSIGRSAKELYRKLQAAKYVHDHGGKEVCPASWEPGDDTLTPGIDLVGKI